MQEPMICVWDDPLQMCPGAPIPSIATYERDLYVAYYTRQHHISNADHLREGAFSDIAPVGLVRFEGLIQLRFGYPNEDILFYKGHSLSKYGLHVYKFQRVENSPWIQDLQVQNKVHPHDSGKPWTNVSHWLVAFHDETLEVIARHASVLHTSADSPTTALHEVLGDSKKNI